MSSRKRKFSTDREKSNKRSRVKEKISIQDCTDASAIRAPGQEAALPGATPKITIENVVSTATLGCPLDLQFIASKAWNVEYNPKKHNSLIMRIRKPRTTVLIYNTGSIVCTGAKSVQLSRRATRRYARIVQKLGFPVRFLDFKIQNVVGSFKTFPINLEKLSKLDCMKCRYDPELFNGAFFNLLPGLTLTVFKTGKVNITGAKTEADVYKAVDAIYPLLCSARKEREDPCLFCHDGPESGAAFPAGFYETMVGGAPKRDQGQGGPEENFFTF